MFNSKHIQCQLCPKRFADNYQLKLHLKAHAGERPHACDQCDKRFLHLKSLRDHVERKHIAAQLPFNCKFCETRFAESNDYEEHLKTHAGEENWFLCDICKKRFPVLQNLLIHLREHATKEKEVCHACPYCNMQFDLKNSLNKHLVKHTGVIKNYQCEQCDKRFALKAQLVVHIRSHTGEKPFVCEDCGKGFTSKFSLLQHGPVHAKEKNFHCRYCVKKFSRHQSKKNHEKVAHAVDTSGTAENATGSGNATHPVAKPVVRSFPCDQCDKVCSTHYRLSEHMKTHEKNKPFTCECCGKNFTLKTYWRRHMAHAHGMEMSNNEDYYESNVVYVTYSTEDQYQEEHA